MVLLNVGRVLARVLALASVASASVQTLGDATFDEFVDSLPPDALLLVDFYKPACRNCQRLSPVLDFLDAEWEREEPDPSRRWFKLAKVDCGKNPRLKKVFGITKIPDLRFVRAGQWSTYEGGRSIEDFKEFKDRMALVPLRAVNGEELVDLLAAEEAVFVLATEDGTDPASVAPGVALAATLMQHTATFCAASRNVLSPFGLEAGPLPALLKVVAAPAGRGAALQTTSFDGDMAATSSWALSGWVEKENYGLVSNFTPENFSRMGSMGKLMVLGIIDPEGEATPAFKQEFDKVASRLGLRHQDKLVFGTMDGVRLRGFTESLRIFDFRDLPRVLVLDMPEDTLYAVKNLRLEAGEMEAFLIDVLSGGIPGQSSIDGSTRYVMKLWWLIEQGGAWSLLLLIPVLGLFWVFCDSPEREDMRAAARDAKRKEKEDQRLKSD